MVLSNSGYSLILSSKNADIVRTGHELTAEARSLGVGNQRYE